MSSIPTAPPRAQISLRELFLEAYGEEHARTMRVLRAYPKDQAELRPHPKARTARELIWTFVTEQGSVEKALTTGFDWSRPPAMPKVPDSFDAVLSAFEGGHAHVAGLIRQLRDDELYRTLQFPTGPGTIGEVPLIKVLWFFLYDQIHHRGQFSVYLRMAGGKVPSIYGPSLDEPWR
ncbi:MAG: DinB family protein [Thermoanaerobaculia bacterium]|jgi:uncharacterized damage-inducible protein DinB